MKTPMPKKDGPLRKELYGNDCTIAKVDIDEMEVEDLKMMVIIGRKLWFSRSPGKATTASGATVRLLVDYLATLDTQASVMSIRTWSAQEKRRPCPSHGLLIHTDDIPTASREVWQKAFAKQTEWEAWVDHHEWFLTEVQTYRYPPKSVTNMSYFRETRKMLQQMNNILTDDKSGNEIPDPRRPVLCAYTVDGMRQRIVEEGYTEEPTNTWTTTHHQITYDPDTKEWSQKDVKPKADNEGESSKGNNEGESSKGNDTHESERNDKRKEKELGPEPKNTTTDHDNDKALSQVPEETTTKLADVLERIATLERLREQDALTMQQQDSRIYALEHALEHRGEEYSHEMDNMFDWDNEEPGPKPEEKTHRRVSTVWCPNHCRSLDLSASGLVAPTKNGSWISHTLAYQTAIQ
ncbi:hypothetical protein CONLIGDRAFT_682932 [Coniochaeta ligniaria NRRL 30616]|uniref:Uncharacterized protein n=1 Tax=Coniochaeta ligniaria NRRL 30616 TaxID=1408157 RepID=A0A1J7JF95_9PEZI|nr:hypothetical protein CONLIGDRAFT_682932 [Coniochaeta ligniaria NRRL 30616]